jgi:hypothetical protein
MTDFTVPASDLTVPSSSVDTSLIDYLRNLTPSGSNNDITGNTINSAATTPSSFSVTSLPATGFDANNYYGVNLNQLLSDADYNNQLHAQYNAALQSGDRATADRLYTAFNAATVIDLANNNVPGVVNPFVSNTQTTRISDTPFSAEDEAIIQQEAAAAAAERARLAGQTQTQTQTGTTPTGLETLVPAGGDQTQTQIQTQPPQGEQVSLGGGETSGRSCPAPWIKITMADGGLVNAGDIKPGMLVYTRHETTGQWGNFPVIAVEQGEDTRWAVLFEGGAEFVGTYNHRVMTDKEWTEIQHLRAGDKVVQHEGFAVVKTVKYLDHGPVVKIEVQDAHTYLSEGVLSHNIKMNEGIQQIPFEGDNFQEIDYAAKGGLMALARGGMTHPFFSKATGKYNFHPAQMYAGGGMPVAMAMGGLGTLGGYSDGGRLLKGPGDGVSDSIPATIGQHAQPARLADGEFVIPARIVSELGNGSTDAGARKLYAMMDRIQRTRSKTVGKDRVAVNSRADKNLPA